MKFLELLKKLEEYNCDYDLQDVEITSNKINGVCCLIFKYHGAVFDVIVLAFIFYIKINGNISTIIKYYFF
ncbi:hypothetical protein [Methanobrevibacter oralis]|uniref:hypothetical protein n=1 Tax=Methanobrevibacter oralis TaxID=66851 RepID=UPI001C735487|nr:hypothetical protein [Methanobrevibacter oralis]